MTKPFEVGERVRIYGATMRGNNSHKLTGFIEEIGEDGFVYVRTDDAPNIPSRCCVHVKQCRRLRKKKRREWSIALPPDPSIWRPIVTCPGGVEVGAEVKTTDGTWIIREVVRVIEIKEKKE